jgi:hypothetical protein
MEFTVANPDSWVCPSCYSRKVAGLPNKPAEYVEKEKKPKASKHKAHKGVN